MFWKKKQEEKKPEKQPYSELRVMLENGAVLSWLWGPMRSDSKLLAPWMPFKKWFHGRQDSQFFTFRWKDGETTVRRADIKRFTVERVMRANET